MSLTLSIWLNRYWNPYFSLIMAGVLCAIYFGLTGTVWAVTGEFTRLGGHLLHLLGIDTNSWTYFDLVKMHGSTFDRSDGWIVWGMFAGALTMILLANNFKIRVPQQKRRLWQGLVGGIIAGFGARMAMGCNLAAFFTGVPQFSFHAWIFIVATAMGTFLGTRIINQRWWKGRPVLSRGRGSAQPSRKKNEQLQPLLGKLFALGYLSVVIYLFYTGKTQLGFGALFGMAFGILVERGQICFTAAFRDLWLLGKATMTKAIVIGMAISSILTLLIISNTDLTPITQLAAPSTFVGGLLFGLGIVMATSCETGMMYRLMEGQIVYVMVFIGNIIGATLLAYSWDHWGVYDLLAASGDKINLIPHFGLLTAISITLALLALLYLYTLIQEKKHFTHYA